MAALIDEFVGVGDRFQPQHLSDWDRQRTAASRGGQVSGPVPEAVAAGTV